MYAPYRQPISHVMHDFWPSEQTINKGYELSSID
jgi:hypothetical protein